MRVKKVEVSLTVTPLVTSGHCDGEKQDCNCSSSSFFQLEIAAGRA